jgi:hypothetical protein
MVPPENGSGMAIEDPPPLNRPIDATTNGSPADWTPSQDITIPDATDAARALAVIDAIAAFHRRHDRTDSASSLGDVLTTSGPPARHDRRVQPDLSKGEPWGPLIVLEPVGRGSFGDVYVAWDPVLAKVVALKQTRYTSAADATRAVLEAQRLASIPPHANVITVHGACNINGVVGIWMEFLRGRTLQRVVQDEGELGWVEATYYGTCLCHALSHVHGALILHRDLKAANVMKAAGGRIVLIDFGSGGEIVPAGAPAPNRLVGTLPYMAPELFDGKPATPQSDIYSLGVLLFNLVSGSYPVSGNSLEDFEKAHRAGRRALLSDMRADLPMPFVEVVERAIDPSVARRYRTAGEFLGALDQLGRPALPARSTVDTWTTRVLWALLIVSFGLTGIGFATTRAFNVALGRTDFAAETVADWFQAGYMASVKPAVIAVVAFVVFQLLSGVKRLVCAMSLGAGQLEARWRQHLGRAARRARLDDPSVLATGLLLLSMTALGSAWWYFSDLLGSVVWTRISTAATEDLTRLSPSGQAYFYRYREVATYITVALVAVWYSTARHVLRTSGSLKNGLLLGGLLVVLVSIITLNIPYRLIVQPKFVAARWSDNDCYIIGERSNDLLVFCPTLTPRTRVVQKGEKIERFDVRNIFEKFGRQDGK